MYTQTQKTLTISCGASNMCWKEKEKERKEIKKEKAIVSSLNVLVMYVKPCNRKEDQKSKNSLFEVVYTLWALRSLKHLS